VVSGAQRHVRLALRDGFLITAAIWILASLVTAIPFMLTAPNLSFTDAVFESTSA
jgi:trk system potassium uptake protein TrkH